MEMNLSEEKLTLKPEPIWIFIIKANTTGYSVVQTLMLQRFYFQLQASKLFSFAKSLVAEM